MRGPYPVEQENPHRAPVGPPVVIAGCPDGQVAHAVAVEIAQRGHRGAELIVIIEHAAEAALGVADLLVGLDRAVRVEKQQPNRATAISPVVIAPCSHGQVAYAVAVEVTQRGHRVAEEVSVVQVTGEATCGVADLLVRQDRAGLGVGGHDRRERLDQCDAQSE